jgi:predicted dehydrogenase
MDSRRIRIGIVGAGSMGKNHARVLASLPGVELAGIYDIAAGRAREVAAAYQSRAMSSLEDLVPLIDAAAVATPTATHLEIGLRLLSAGRDVFLEKPITDDAAGARQLIEKAQESRRILQVGHIERFNPVISQLEKLLTHPRFIEAHRLSPFPDRSTDIGVVLDLMIHDLEVILHLVKSEIESIDAVGIPVLTRREDIANARLRFQNGCVANITTSRVSPEKMRKIRVFQDDAYLSLDYQNQSGEIYRKGGVFGIAREPVKIEKDEPLKLELAAFVECARHGRQPKVGGQQAAAALEWALEITSLIEMGGGYRTVNGKRESKLRE